jgi:hypothetical protein
MQWIPPWRRHLLSWGFPPVVPKSHPVTICRHQACLSLHSCNTLGVKLASALNLMSIIITLCISIIYAFHSRMIEVLFHVVLELIEIHHV